MTLIINMKSDCLGCPGCAFCLESVRKHGSYTIHQIIIHLSQDRFPCSSVLVMNKPPLKDVAATNNALHYLGVCV
jgi:hypothetical protein